MIPHRLLCAALCCASASAQLAADNLYVATSVNTFPIGYRIREFTVTGALVQELPVPHPSGAHPVTERLRDIAVHPSGDIYAFNGTFTPYLSVRRAATGQWEHHSHPQWSTANNGSYGGVALSEHAVFVTSAQTAFVSGGLLRFEQPSLTPTVFATQFVGGFVDVAVGWDGLLYALSTTEDLPSPIGTWLFAPQQPYFVFAVPAGAPLQLPIPADCALTGLVFHAQGISVSVATCAFANALDVRIGGF